MKAMTSICSLAFVLLGATETIRAQTITEFPLLVGKPWGIAAGPDGSLWFTDPFANTIGRITTKGQITQFTIPTPDSDPRGIAAGPDGNVWFTERLGNRIGRITPAGVITEFLLPYEQSQPTGIAAGPDGNLWFTETAHDLVGVITTGGGVIHQFDVSTEFRRQFASAPVSITAGPDGAMWVAENGVSRVTRVTMEGSVTHFPVAYSNLSSITTGSDGNLWFTVNGGYVYENKICRITPDGVVTQFGDYDYDFLEDPAWIAAGPDGHLWFTHMSGSAIGRITTEGIFTKFTIPTPNSAPVGITAGPDGNIWFAESAGGKIGRLTLKEEPEGPGARRRGARRAR